MSDTLHMAPPPAWGFIQRGYCGRRADKTTNARGACTCTDCHAAREADEKANRR